jgi:hypothetical protein
MVIAFDYHETITRNEKLFKQMALGLRSLGIPVFIISAIKIPSADGSEKLRRECKVPNDGVEIVYFKDYGEIAELKLKACKRYSVTLMFDDSEAVCRLLAKNGILTAQVR